MIYILLKPPYLKKTFLLSCLCFSRTATFAVQRVRREMGPAAEPKALAASEPRPRFRFGDLPNGFHCEYHCLHDIQVIQTDLLVTDVTEAGLASSEKGCSIAGESPSMRSYLDGGDTLMAWFVSAWIGQLRAKIMHGDHLDGEFQSKVPVRTCFRLSFDGNDGNVPD